MIAVLVMFALSFLTILSPGRAIFVGMGCLLSVTYLFTANIAIDVLGVHDFIRYSKEPLILAVIVRFAVPLLLNPDPARIRHEYKQNSAQAQIAWGKAGKLSILILIGWSGFSFFLAGLAGFAGYIRGIVFPAIFLLYLSRIQDDQLRKLADVLAIASIAFIVFLALASVVHFRLDENFLIPDSFKNRLDYSAAYQSIVAYGQIERYQSFFGDPNRTALVCILALWFSCIGRTGRFRWAIYAITIPVLWVTESRTGMLVAALWGFYLFVRSSSIRDIPVFVIIAALISAGGALVWFSSSSRIGSIEEVSRLMIWAGLVQHLVSSPQIFMFGEGFGWVGQTGSTFAVSDAVQLTSASGRSIMLSVIDNSYLTLLSSLGLFGTLAFLSFYKSVLTEMARRLGTRKQACQFWILVWLIMLWSFFFDALVSFPWTFFFPLLLRCSVISAEKLEAVPLVPAGSISYR